MGKARKAARVKLIAGTISNDPRILDKAAGLLRKRFGGIDFQSPCFDFDQTDYYREELGENLKKTFFSFSRLIDPSELPDIKIFTNKIETAFSLRGRRRINIDPGYLDLAKLVLATTKDYSHRIYLRKGIYAEITLIYRNKSYRALEWTYPDYKSREYNETFISIRNIYASQIKNRSI